MGEDRIHCHGEVDCLKGASESIFVPTRLSKLAWHMRHDGIRGTLKAVKLRVRRLLAGRAGGRASAGAGDAHGFPEVLNLQPGDRVRVRSESQIASTLDACGRSKGLAWMPRMREACGKEFRVYKRVNRIVLESTGEIRALKNTVLLANCVCEGIYNCDRSCFFFWKEVWLERVAGSQQDAG
ncbi:MAG: hypothetical protein ABFE13_26575 [Phycisphaerales bacterium]